MIAANRWSMILRQIFIFFFIPLHIYAQPLMEEERSETTKPIPQWFKDSKLGIHFQWGPYSVGSWSPKGSFASWYQYWLINRTVFGNGEYSGTEVYDYHQSKYGPDINYYDFGYEFKALNYRPDEWIQMAKSAGARYVLFNAKHLDGYCLWPSSEAEDRGFKWSSDLVGPRKDLLGLFKTAVDSTQLKWGVSYALQEWFHPWWRSDRERYVRDHVFPQIQDLLDSYQPDIFWTTGEWELSSREWKSASILNWIYTASKVKDKVVVNDRWGKDTKQLFGGYHTTEYSSGIKESAEVWEEHRGIGMSLGFNKNENLTDYASSQALVLSFVDIVSRGGNLLLNIGPDADGRISPIQQQRMSELGAWLEINGEAIYSSTKWRNPHQWTAGTNPEDDESTYIGYTNILAHTVKPLRRQAVKQAFFTYKKGCLYAILPQYPSGDFWLRDVQSTDSTKVSLLANGKKVEWTQVQNDIRMRLPNFTPDLISSQNAYVIKMSHVKGFVQTPKIIVENEQTDKPPTKVTLLCENPDALILFTLDGSEPTTKSKLYKRPFIVKKSAKLRVKAFVEGLTPSKEVSRDLKKKSRFREVILEVEPNDPYRGFSPTLLINGKRGVQTKLGDGQWMGFLGNDAQVVIDLGEQKKIRRIKLGYLHQPSEGIFAPEQVNIEVSTDFFNYKGFKGLSKIDGHSSSADEGVNLYETPIYNTKARYVYIHVKNIGECPSSHPNAGDPSWLFLDEIVIE